LSDVFSDCNLYWNIDDYILVEDSLVDWEVDNYFLVEDSLCYWDIGYTYKLTFPYISINWNIAPNVTVGGQSIGYFDSVIPVNSNDTASYSSDTATDYEKESIYSVRLYAQLPDTGTEIAIPYDDIISWSLSWGLNQAVIWAVKLSNAERQYTSKTGTYKGLFAKGVWSYTKKCRKFFRLEVAQYINRERVVLFSMPRLVINNRQFSDDGYVMSVGGIDEISEYLKNRKVTINSFCGTETLTPISTTAAQMDGEEDGETVSDIGTSYTQFQSYALTKTDFTNRTEVIINGQNVSRGMYSWDSANKQLTIDTPVLEKYRVMVRNPMGAKWILQEIAKLVIDLQATKITKEYFPIICNFTDFEIFEELSCISSPAMSIFEEVIDAMGGEYLITPVGNKLAILIRQVPLDSEYPTAPQYRLVESLYRGSPDVNSSNLEKFNTINVIKPHITEVSYEQTIQMTEATG
jgi:hypothetical protein